MERAVRRKDRQISQEEAKKLLESAEYGVISSVGEGNIPYGVPISYIYIEDKLYIHCAKKGRKNENFQNNDAVSFCVVGKTEPIYEPGNFSTVYESAIARGTISLVEDREEKVNALRLLCMKYLPEHEDKIEKAIEASYQATAVYVISVKAVTGKAKKAV